MPRTRKKLTALHIRNAKSPGRYNDGGGLYLYVNKSGQRYWIFRYRDRATGKLRDKGLGPGDDVSIVEARERARKHRGELRDGIDPIDKKRKRRAELILAKAKQVTFKDCADLYIKAHGAGWSNDKHTSQWTNTLNTYCIDLMPLPVSSIDTTLVLQCIEPIWATKTVTATRVRQRIERVLDWAKVRKYRMGENPARWTGHLEQLLVEPSKLTKVRHLPALSYKKVGEFMAKLRKVDEVAARALELQILTATRPGEIVGSRWEEFDLEAALWTIPEERTKAKKEHKVPLSKQAVNLLEALPKVSGFVFTGISVGRHLTTEAGLKCLKKIEPNVTAHGFRSTFRDWAADRTNYPREVCEHALAHQLKDKAEAAYKRSSQLAKRKKLMRDWANYLDKVDIVESDKVTPIRGRNRTQ